MPVTDLLTRVTDSTTGRPVISALAAPKAIGAATASLTDVTNWTTSSAIHFVIYETTASGIKDPTTQTDWKGTLSGTTVSNLTLTGGTDRAYSTGAKVELTPTARFAKDLYDNVIAHANQDGTLKTAAVQAALNIAATSTDWTPLANTPTLASSAGQREHVLQFTGVNYTDRLQAGTKLQIPRTGTTPTTSMAFVAASSQYASKSSPTGITFTDDWTWEGWRYFDSYTSSNQTLCARKSGTNGFRVSLNSSGQIVAEMQPGNATTRVITSYQSVPLTKHTHIAVTMDGSGGTSATNKIFIDGVDVPTSITGTATTLTQAGDLRIGNDDGTTYGNYKAANDRLWSVIRTPAQIRDNMNMEVPASTTGLVGHWKGNGSWNDSSSNANHLTAVGGAVNNSATHPYSATEYAIVTKTEFTGGNTAVTVFTGSNCLPNETLGTASYSSTRAPYGFPADRGRWCVEFLGRTNASQAGAALSTWYNLSSTQLNVPTGRWLLSYQAVSKYSSGSNGNAAMKVTLSTGLNTETDSSYTHYAQANTTLDLAGLASRQGFIAPSTPTTYYLNAFMVAGAGTPTLLFNGGDGATVIRAECAYL